MKTAPNNHYISMHNWSLIFIAVFPAGGSCDCPQGPPTLRLHTIVCTQQQWVNKQYTYIYPSSAVFLLFYLSLQHNNNRMPCCTMAWCDVHAAKSALLAATAAPVDFPSAWFNFLLIVWGYLLFFFIRPQQRIQQPHAIEIPFPISRSPILDVYQASEKRIEPLSQFSAKST